MELLTDYQKALEKAIRSRDYHDTVLRVMYHQKLALRDCMMSEIYTQDQQAGFLEATEKLNYNWQRDYLLHESAKCAEEIRFLESMVAALQREQVANEPAA